MPKKPKAPHKSSLELNSALDDPYFALLGDIDFPALIGPLGVLPGGPYDYAYVAHNAKSPGNITIGADLETLNGVIATGNGKDNIDLSNSSGDNLVYAGNGKDNVTGGMGNDTVFGGNGKDNLNGGMGNDHLEGGNAKDVLNGGDNNDYLSGGQSKDVLIGGPDDGTVELTFSATDSSGEVMVLEMNGTVLDAGFADGTALVTSDPGLPPVHDVIVEAGIYVDTSATPDAVYHVFNFTPTDAGGDGGLTAFNIGVYDLDGTLVDSFAVNMEEGLANYFSFVDSNLAGDDGGSVAVFDATTPAPLTFAEAMLTAIDSENYEPVTLTLESVLVTPGDELYGGQSKDTFVYNEGDGVDVIYDYQKGDKLQINGIDPADVTTVVEGGNTYILFSDGAGGTAADAAIELVNVTNQPDIQYG